MSKYKYYFRRPKSEIVKDIFYWLMTAGAVSVAATSPYFLVNLTKSFKKWQKYKKAKVSDAFYQLRRRGYIKVEKKNQQIYISLTEKGKKKAGWLQIDALKIKRNKKWDKKWRIVVFDISQLKKFYREAFRGKLKELGFYPLQKSVWGIPFQCQDEIGLLKDFFGLTDKEVRLVVAQEIGEVSRLKKHFGLE